MRAVAAFELRLELMQACLAKERYQIARIEALAMAAVEAKGPKDTLRAACIRQGLDGPDPMPHWNKIGTFRTRVQRLIGNRIGARFAVLLLEAA